ncbi:helix-turn-helix transcriptional regulator [Angustibacter sp. McL0619]|uniref:helix-turn-helix transcriptional regulator n=1 Tax=Angustibacter sp. McL0619 TaxID=3415676 RepID=UPI003CF9AA65
MSDQDFETQVNRVSLLAEPVRRALYEYVASAPDAVGRVEAADATGVPGHTAKFHLDKLVEEGLLATEFRRLSGRTGPGAGRPSKLYRRSAGQVELSLPRRRYELAGQLLASAVSTAAARDLPVLDCVRDVAQRTGQRLGAQSSATGTDELDRVSAAVHEHGYEPRRVGDDVELSNCPFDALVDEHRDLVCGMNLALLDGVVDGLGCENARPRLDPAPGRCCVVVGQAPLPG